MPDVWKPAQYEKFKDERAQPFFDLLGMVRPAPGGRAVDLGCGTGELTRRFHEHTQAAQTVGVDNSAAMLAKAAAFAGGGLTFQSGDIAAFAGGPWDVIFSNAALHWVGDHPALLARLCEQLSPGGQLAVQIPTNFDHPSHSVAHALAQEAPWRDRLSGYVLEAPVLLPEQYAEQLHALGFAEQGVRLQVYGHLLTSADGVVEWVKGTLLTDYERRLSQPHFAEFLGAYRERLLALLPDGRPYFFAFKRVLFWARRPLP